MEVFWSGNALSELTGINDYIAKDSRFYARRMVERIINRSEQIAAFPDSGRKVPEHDNPDIREVIEGNYRIIYHVGGTRIVVLAVVHCARVFPDNPL